MRRSRSRWAPTRCPAARPARRSPPLRPHRCSGEAASTFQVRRRRQVLTLTLPCLPGLLYPSRQGRRTGHHSLHVTEGCMEGGAVPSAALACHEARRRGRRSAPTPSASASARRERGRGARRAGDHDRTRASGPGRVRAVGSRGSRGPRGGPRAALRRRAPRVNVHTPSAFPARRPSPFDPDRRRGRRDDPGDSRRLTLRGRPGFSETIGLMGAPPGRRGPNPRGRACTWESIWAPRR